MYQFSVITNHHKLSSLKQHRYLTVHRFEVSNGLIRLK